MAKAKKPKVTVRKYMGDDAYSWAVFIEGQTRPIVNGLARGEAAYYKKKEQDRIDKQSDKG